ncbi:hemolysin family protein [Ureaplasma urealyticum]|uniref:hemolysin family protein n=1 Tax=Ureaplasma urealyticum TaxID=2130 RepID=UPI0001793C60|nr:hemolysin family protein [Ureaplasma urealyticum]EDX53131.1 hemolysin [Ureaplasma urealyticum serovar 12 str. ATCC 33696]EDX54091.1 hemolysin [Ureaplasma urealyticum serovar 9 str. ATCC 33175]EDY74690.1 hemolysin [Ureaplasma urealyticum serovar 4 str. ATCC 27816]UIU15139.1 hemolysin family protein [Ureaplasma urealyticum]
MIEDSQQIIDNQTTFSVGVLIILAIITIILICFSAFFSATETAVTSVTTVKWKTESNKIKSKTIINVIYKMINNYTITLATILIGNTLVNTASSTIAGLFFAGIVKSFSTASNAEAIGTGIATGIMTLIVLLFGEFIPKNFAKKNPIKILKLVAYPLNCFYVLFWPLTWLLNRMFNKKLQSVITATEEELKSLVEVIRHEGTLDSQEALIINKAILFDDILINQKMVPWNQVVKISENKTVLESFEIFNSSGFSRLVVINKDDEVVGIIHLKKIIKYLLNEPNTIIKDIMETPLLMNQKDTLYDGLRTMQFQRIHLGIVVDNITEKNPIGIITLENITEELTGNVYDETDNENEIKEIQVVNETTWRVNAKTNAKLFLHQYIDKNIEVDDDINMGKYIAKINKNRAFKNRQLINTPNMYIETFKDVRTNQFAFLIEKKINKL